MEPTQNNGEGLQALRSDHQYQGRTDLNNIRFWMALSLVLCQYRIWVDALILHILETVIFCVNNDETVKGNHDLI